VEYKVQNSNHVDSFIEEEIDLSQYWKVINSRKWGIMGLALLITLIVALIVFSMSPIYKATSTLLIEQQQPKLPSIDALYGLAGKDKQYYLTQIELLKSRKLAEHVIHDLKLDSNQEFLPKEGGFHPVSALKSWLSLDDKDDKDEEDHTLDMVVAGFQNRLTVSLIKDTQLLTLSFEAESPKLAAKVANTLGNTYIDDQMVSRLEMTQKATHWMEQRLEVLKGKLEQSEQVLQHYKESNGLIDVKGVSTLTAQELDELTSQLVVTRAKYSELAKRYGAKHPQLIVARSEFKAAEKQLMHSKSKIQNIGRKEVKLRELQRQVKSNRQLYDTFMDSLKEASQAVDLQASNARISDPAVAPIKPIKPKKGMIIGLAFFASLMFGVLLAFLLEALDRTFKSPSDVESKLGQAVLGVLPLIHANVKDRKSQAVAMLDEGKQSAYGEAMRTIRTGLILSSLDNPHKVILVTSSIPGEGKTSVSSNLALAMAKMEKVLLIGADLRRPSLSKVFSVKSSLGLSNIVAGTSKFSECIHRIEDAGIDFLPCGLLPPNPLELLSSDRFAKTMELLEKNYDRIVIDSPPVQAVSDALVLSKYAKAVVYVVEADKTHEDLVKNGIKRLLQYDAPIAGIVLNKFNVDKAEKYGYDYSGYYDHYGYDDKA